MNVVSVLGMLSVLGVAWLLSSDRSLVRPRILLWGVGLQFLLALVLLRDDYWSLLGVVIFAGLLAFYLARSVAGATEQACVGTLLLGLAVGLILTRLPPQALGVAVVVPAIFLVVNGRLRLAPRSQPWIGVWIVVAGVGWIVASGTSIRELFAGASYRVASFLSLADYGSKFLFGNLADDRFYFPASGSIWPGFGYLFAFKLLPVIVFFGAFMAVLYYLGIVQRLIGAVARFMRWTMGTGGAETLCAATNIFIGQTESPLLIKPYLPGMTRSELAAVMVGGFATIAGSALAGYIAMGMPPAHLLAAMVLSAPASLVIAKMLFPDTTRERAEDTVRLETIDAGGNLIEAASIGITDGWKLAVNVGAMLVGFISLIAVVDVSLNQLDALIDGRLLGGLVFERLGSGISPITREFAGVFPGSLQTLFGTLLRPAAWLLGVPWEEAGRVGHLLGIKLSLNEFVAYGALSGYIQNAELSERSVILSTYALCGFANFASIGMQIGGLSAIAPSRRADFAKVGLKAMLGGALASWLTATIAGTLIQV